MSDMTRSRGHVESVCGPPEPDGRARTAAVASQRKGERSEQIIGWTLARGPLPLFWGTAMLAKGRFCRNEANFYRFQDICKFLIHNNLRFKKDPNGEWLRFRNEPILTAFPNGFNWLMPSLSHAAKTEQNRAKPSNREVFFWEAKTAARPGATKKILPRVSDGTDGKCVFSYPCHPRNPWLIVFAFGLGFF
jgi:hypothetical protein